MTEINPVYIPCAAGTRTQTDFLIRHCPYDSALIEILGHPIMDITPQDARKAAMALLAMADQADGVKTPYIATYRRGSVDAPEMIVATEDVTALKTALKTALENLT